jgi:hypothetical protein
MGRGSSGQRWAGYQKKRELQKHRGTVQDADDEETDSGCASRNIGILYRVHEIRGGDRYVRLECVSSGEGCKVGSSRLQSPWQ